MKQIIHASIILRDGGEIHLELYPEIAPITVKNFVELAKSDYYCHTIFHRIIEGFMIQGGGFTIEDHQLVQKENHNPIIGEFKSNGIENTLKHQTGVISMARTSVKNSATGQFFICSVDTPHLDGEYAAFGKVSDRASLKKVVELSKMRTSYYPMPDFPTNPPVIEKIVIED